MELAQLEPGAERLHGLAAQALYLETTDHVCIGLTRPGDVPIDLVFAYPESHSRVVTEELDRPATGPALGVDAGVDHEPTGT